MQERHKKFAFRKQRGNRKEGLHTGCDEHGFCVVGSTEQRDIPLCRGQAGFSRASSLNPSRTEGIIFLYLRNRRQASLVLLLLQGHRWDTKQCLSEAR